MRTLNDDIFDRAKSTFTEVDWKDKDAVKAWYNKESWRRWYDHWLTTAAIIRDEFLAEGLVQTAAKIQEHIDFNEKFHPKNDKPEEPMSRRVEDWLIADGFPILLFVDPETGERLTPEDV